MWGRTRVIGFESNSSWIIEIFFEFQFQSDDIDLKSNYLIAIVVKFVFPNNNSPVHCTRQICVKLIEFNF